MKVGLIDPDFISENTRFPNLALMKLSSYYNNAPLINYDEVNNYDKIFISKVFTETKVPKNILEKKNVEYGGTGFYFDNATPLPEKIEHIKPNYSLYIPLLKKKEEDLSKSKWKYHKDYSIGFTTRGCFRQCDFCINRNKKRVVKHSPINEFLDKDKKYITLLDDNILAFKGWKEIIKKLISIGKPFNYEQGLDIRLMTEEKAKLLNEAKYKDDYIFAFDDWEEKDIIIPKIKLWNKYRSDSDPKFYLLTAYKSKGIDDIVELFKRIKVLMKLDCLPYVIRYNNYEESDYRGMYIAIAGWCNQPHIFKKMSLEEYALKRNEYTQCKDSFLRYLEDFKSKHPKLYEKYCTSKYEDF